MSDPEVYRRLAALERWADAMAAVEVPGMPEAWVSPTLLNSWVNYGGEFNTAGYYKDPFGRVHLRGLIKDGTATAGTVLFVLPSGYRPSATEVCSTLSNAAAADVQVAANGDVKILIGSNVWLSLDGISFRAA